MEPKNKNAYGRCIYIHGTAAERDLGKPASYGCVRMKSKDVIDLHDRVGVGSKVFVVQKGLWRDVEKGREMGEPITALPLAEVDAPMAMNGVAPPAVAPLNSEVSTIKTGYDVLEESGFDTTYLQSNPPVELKVD